MKNLELISNIGAAACLCSILLVISYVFLYDFFANWKKNKLKRSIKYIQKHLNKQLVDSYDKDYLTWQRRDNLLNGEMVKEEINEEHRKILICLAALKEIKIHHI